MRLSRVVGVRFVGKEAESLTLIGMVVDRIRRPG